MQSVVPEKSNTVFDYSGLLTCMLNRDMAKGTRDYRVIPQRDP